MITLQEALQLFSDFKAGELLKDRTIREYKKHIFPFIYSLPP